MGFSWQEQWNGLLFPPPVDHILSELFTLTFPSWVALLSVAHGFTELHKPLHHNTAVIHQEILIGVGGLDFRIMYLCIYRRLNHVVL